MEQENSQKKELVTYRWANLVIGIAGLVLGLICFIGGFGFFGYPYSSIDPLFMVLGAIYFLESVAMIIFGVLACISFRQNANKLVSCAFMIPACWSLFSSIESIIAGIVTEKVLSMNGYTSYGMVINSALIMLVLYLAAGVVLLIAAIRAGKCKGFKVVGLVGSIIMLAGILISLISQSSSQTSVSGVTITLDLILIAICVFVIILSLKSRYEDAKEDYGYSETPEWPEEKAVEEHTLNVDEEAERKAKALHAYKELLDEGIITKEEYEKKKSELL